MGNEHIKRTLMIMAGSTLPDTLHENGLCEWADAEWQIRDKARRVLKKKERI